jgi:hypothetical protein
MFAEQKSLQSLFEQCGVWDVHKIPWERVPELCSMSLTGVAFYKLFLIEWCTTAADERWLMPFETLSHLTYYIIT